MDLHTQPPQQIKNCHVRSVVNITVKYHSVHDGIMHEVL